MKVGNKIVALCLGATLALGSMFGLAACKEGEETGSTGDPNIRLVYDMYVDNCAAKGEDALTYEDWLASIKGEDGKDGNDGVTPHIGDNGNWYIGSADTGVKAEGKDGSNGVTPHIDTESGHWFIGEEDTGISATGAKGDDGGKGDDGKDGNGWLYGDQIPADTLGKDGDLYLNYTDWKVYTKDGGHWTERGSIKGEKGDKGDKGDSATGGETDPSETVIKEYKSVTINASESYQLDLTEVASGYYWLVADTQTAVAPGVLSAESTVSYTQGSRTATATSSYDLYSSKNTRFRGVVAVDTDTSTQKITVYNKSTESITADLKLVEYTPVTLTLGQEFEIPCLSTIAINGTAGRAPVLFDTSSMQGKEVKITVTYAPDLLVNPVLRYNSVAGERPSNISSENWWPETDKQDGIWAHTFTMPANALELFFLNGNTANRIGFNAVVKIELAEVPSDAVKTWDNVTVTTGGSQTLDCTGLEAGLYWLSAETETEAAIGVLKAAWTNPLTTGSYVSRSVTTDLYSPSNGFKGVVYVSGTESLTLSTSQASVTANYKLYEYEPVTVVANTECEIPMTISGLPSVPLVFDSTLTGTVKVSLIGVPDSFSGMMLYYATEASGSQTRAGIFQKNKSFVNDAVALNNAAVEWYVSSGAGSSIEPYIYNIKIKIELAS